MSETECFSGDDRQLTLFEVDRREVTVAFDGGDVVTDTGLLAIRQLDLGLGVLSEAKMPSLLAESLPVPPLATTVAEAAGMISQRQATSKQDHASASTPTVESPFVVVER